MKNNYIKVFLSIFFCSFLFFSSFATSITVRLRDNGGNTVPNASTATLQVYDGGWTTKTNDGSGNFSVTSSSGSITYRMSYHNGIEEKTLSTTITTVDFITVSVTTALKDCGSNALSGGAYQYYQNGWSGVKTANTAEEMLPGTYTVQMSYHNGIKTQSSVAVSGSTQEILFTTTSMTAALKDCSSNALTGGTYQYYQNGWSGVKTANTAEEVLPGTYTVQMSYHNGIKTQSSVAISGCDQEVLFTTTSMTAALKDCGNNALTGGTYQYYQNGWSGVKTPNTAEEVLPGTYTVQMSYHNGIKTQSSVAISGCTWEVLFETTSMTAALKDCGNNALTGGTYQYYQNGWSGVKTANTAEEVLPGTYTVQMSYHNGIKTQSSVAISGCTKEVLFQATKVAFAFSGSIQYYQNGWGSYSNPTYLLAGDYTFQFTQTGEPTLQQVIAVSGCEMKYSPVIFVLKDHNNNPLSGGTAHWSVAYCPGSTNASGLLLYLAPGVVGTATFDMSYNHTAQFVTQNVSANSYFHFKTSLVTLRLETCSGSPLSGGAARFGGGTAYGSYFWPGGNTNVTGETKSQMFPGTYSIEMGYQSTTQVKSSVGIVSGTNTLTWKTTKLTLQHSGDIAYGGSGDSRYFNKPSMELLPGVINFNFRAGGNGYYALTIPSASCTELKYSAVKVKMMTSTGVPLPGNLAEYHTGSWTSMGNTNAGGVAVALIPGLVSNAYFRATYAYATQQKGPQNIVTNSICEFKTTNVSLNLMDHTGTLITAESGTAGYYTSAWHTLGSTGANGFVKQELLPGSYYFNMKYNNYTQQQGSLSIGTGPNQNIDFRTTLVTLNLKNHNGSLITSESGTGGYYTGAWYSLGSTGANGYNSIELLPGSGYYFNMNYNYYTQQQGSMSVVGGGTWTQNVDFQTTLVTLNLKDHTGNLITAEDGTGGYYTAAWHTLGSTSGTGMNSKELLPGSGYYFNMNFHFGTQQKGSMSVTTGPTQDVDFQTALVTIHFQGNTGIPHAGATINHYSNSWQSLGITDANGDASMEMLPVPYYYNATLTGYGTTQIGTFTDASGGTPTHIIAHATLNKRSSTSTTVVPEAVEFSVYPNPANNMISVKFDNPNEGKASIKVVDLTGRLVIDQIINSAKGTNTIDINLSSLSSGLYLLQFENGTDNKVIRISVNH